MRLRIYILFICLAISVQYAFGQDKCNSLFKITRIKTKGNYYVIHSTRNDSLFKIISKKVNMDLPNLKLLKKGEYYYFDFGNSVDKESKRKTKQISGVVNYLDIKKNSKFIDGDTKIKFSKRFHYRLYTTKSIIGLYYIPLDN